MARSFLSPQFRFSTPCAVNFVGGGGKTSVILQLAGECPADVLPLYTTTTRMHPPPPQSGLLLLKCEDESLLQKLLADVGEKNAGQGFRLAAARGEVAPGLLGGLHAGFARRLDPRRFPLILNEADGARGGSLKLPREDEPVLMEGAFYLVPVIGLDCLGAPAGPRSIFRWERFGERSGLREGEIVTPEAAARVLMGPHGVCRDCPPGTRIIPFVNKVDGPSDDGAARELATRILENPWHAVESVVWGSVHAARAGVVRRAPGVVT